MAEYSVLGRRLPRVDGPVKATGRARFTDDLSLPGMLVGKILRSPHAHADDPRDRHLRGPRECLGFDAGRRR